MIYLASPYSHPDAAVRHARFLAVCETAATMMRAGLLVFSPIAHSHPIAEFGLPKGWDFWEEYDMAFIEMCYECAVLCIDGWEESKGVQAEVELFRQAGKPVTHITLQSFAEYFLP